MYAGQIERLLDVFPRERVLVLQYERCQASFFEQARRTYAFLGVDPEFVPAAKQMQPRAASERDAGPADRRSLAERYVEDVRRLAELAPELDPELWPNIRPLI